MDWQTGVSLLVAFAGSLSVSLPNLQGHNFHRDSLQIIFMLAADVSFVASREKDASLSYYMDMYHYYVDCDWGAVYLFSYLVPGRQSGFQAKCGISYT